jgi:hypothetical protein
VIHRADFGLSLSRCIAAKGVVPALSRRAGKWQGNGIPETCPPATISNNLEQEVKMQHAFGQ